MKELDECQITYVSHIIPKIRDIYLTLIDTITKNLDEIKKPRPNHFEDFYYEQQNQF